MIKLTSHNNFLIYSTKNASEDESIKSILEHMLIEFDLIFTKSLTSLEPCYISKNYALGYPILITNEDNLRISLAVDSYLKWNQTVYQLSHELCHYILNQTANGKETLKWFEETLCEAMSLYILDFFYETWSDCSLSQYNSKYFTKMKSYLDNELVKHHKNGLKSCKTIEDLNKINSRSEIDRSDRISERNNLFELFKSNKGQKEKIALIKDYQKYISSNGLTIDFAKWYEETGEEFIQKLSKIQPI
ncbi:hypothetical protein [Clostridium perfringens]|uniref:hypothetical protein n=1 Tax=Clostridium perfringens TaxID=1502 RepID=UPI00123F468C|nr:hypothetical protein [Clostridium perfringens]MDU7724876.1 hypothetical protein [Clostridium perfringens]